MISPISLASISFSRSIERPRSSNLLRISYGRIPNCLIGLCHPHSRFSIILLIWSIRPAISGQFLCRAISKRARIIRLAFLENKRNTVNITRMNFYIPKNTKLPQWLKLQSNLSIMDLVWSGTLCYCGHLLWSPHSSHVKWFPYCKHCLMHIMKDNISDHRSIFQCIYISILQTRSEIRDIWLSVYVYFIRFDASVPIVCSKVSCRVLAGLYSLVTVLSQVAQIGICWMKSSLRSHSNHSGKFWSFEGHICVIKHIVHLVQSVPTLDKFGCNYKILLLHD